MVVAFGSIGDFVAVANLIREILQLAAGSANMRKDIRELTLHLADVQRSIDDVWRGYSGSLETLPSATKNCIELHVRRCREHLEGFRSETKSIITGSLRSIGQRAMFAYRREDVIRKVQTNIDRDIQALQLCMQAVTADQSQQVSQRAKRLESTSDATGRSLRALLVMLGSMPKELGYTWEGGELKQQITLTQASGEIMLLPLEFCSSPEVCDHFNAGGAKADVKP